MSIKRLTQSLLLTAMIIILLPLTSSCGDSPSGPTPHKPVFLFDPINGMTVDLEPEHINRSGANVLNFNLRPLFSGTGFLWMAGHGGGNDIGEVMSPIQETLGVIAFPIKLEKGELIEIPVHIEFFPQISYVTMTCVAKFDSLIIDGEQYWIGAEEVSGILGFEAINGATQFVVLNEEQEK